MAVRVKVRIEFRKPLETSALVNTGFEADTPTVIFPLKVAEKLGFKTSGLEREAYVGPNGTPIFLYPLQGGPKISVVAEGRKAGRVEVDACVGFAEDEVVLSDAASSSLGISIVDPKLGIWRFRDEEKERRSVQREKWI